MCKVCAGTDGVHAQIMFLKQEIKQKRFRSKFEIKIWNDIKLKFVFKSNRIWYKPTVSFKINFQIQIEHESEIHFCNENCLQRKLGPHGPP